MELYLNFGKNHSNIHSLLIKREAHHLLRLIFRVQAMDLRDLIKEFSPLAIKYVGHKRKRS
ncbi:hypothetical protein SAMN05444487_11913 [Marininema mesophilum]|uniref:Uncharacterized protein n=1 Tax=Marininema mesophilum TaxID=1048340 RepID=A0A1H3C0L1_9BACL|nr:hypothetical protein SAMN05444487_11913 [Marininema mesophilum]